MNIRHRSVAPPALRLSELDALRGVAAFLVLLRHARVMGLDASGAALALSGPLPSLTRGHRLAGGTAAVGLSSLWSSDLAVYAASVVLLIVLARRPGGFQRLLRCAPLV